MVTLCEKCNAVLPDDYRYDVCRNCLQKKIDSMYYRGDLYTAEIDDLTENQLGSIIDDII